MTILQACLIGLYYWFGWMLIPVSAILFTPLPASLWVGLIMGNVTDAVIVGATIQLIYLGQLYAGGQTIQDELAATLVATPLVLLSGLDAPAAIAVAVPIGLICAQLANLQQIANSIPVHMSDRYAEKGNTTGVYFSTLIMPILVRLVVRAIPMTILVYLGGTFAGTIANNIPPIVTNALNVVGGVMPAVGFSIVAFTIGRAELFPFLIAGFFLMKYTGMSVIAASLLGAFLAFLYWFFIIHARAEDTNDESIEEEEEVEFERMVGKKELLKSFFLWIMFGLVAESYERKTGPNFLAALLPSLKVIYKNKPDELKDAMVRHMGFFNTECCFGACIPGMVIAMEEQKAQNRPVTGEVITTLKTGLMGPFAGIGDAAWGMFEPMVIGLFVAGATTGSWLAVVGDVVTFTLLFTLVGYYSFWVGYKSCTNSAQKLLGKGGLTSLLPVFSILGMFMMGALAANYINANIPIVINVGQGGSFPIQKFLDSIVPGLLPFAVFMFAYGVTKKFKNFLYTALIILAMGLILGLLGVLA